MIAPIPPNQKKTKTKKQHINIFLEENKLWLTLWLLPFLLSVWLLALSSSSSSAHTHRIVFMIWTQYSEKQTKKDGHSNLENQPAKRLFEWIYPSFSTPGCIVPMYILHSHIPKQWLVNHFFLFFFY